MPVPKKLAPKEWLSPPRAFGRTPGAGPRVPLRPDGHPVGTLQEMTTAFLQHLLVIRITEAVTLQDQTLAAWCDKHAGQDFGLSAGHLQNVLGGFEPMSLTVAAVATRLLGPHIWLQPEVADRAIGLVHRRYSEALGEGTEWPR